MDQGPGATGARVTDSSDPEEIRQKIEATREQLGDTVAALAAKADVKAQAKQKIYDTKTAVAGKKEEILGKAKEAAPDTPRTAANQLSAEARQNPVPLAVAGAFALGFLAGWVLRR